MTLLEEIQKEAVDSQSDLSALLRKCKLLGARLGSRPLEDWLLWESNGYPSDVPVPDYRIWELTLTGYFSGFAGSGLNNAPIPLACLPDHVRPVYESHQCRQSVAALEALLKTGGQSFNVSTGDLSLILGDTVYEDMNCLQAKAHISAGQLVEVLNNVRNRLLDFALALWKEDHSAGELTTSGAAQVDEARVTYIFQTTVNGGSAVIGGNVSLTVEQGNVASLKAALTTQGVGSSDIEGLASAVSEDPKPESKEAFGPRVSAWLGKMMVKATEGTVTAGAGVAGKFLIEVIAKYYGLSL